MATHFDRITDEQADLIREAKIFFVASVAPDLSGGPEQQGPVNASPKGGVPLHVLDENRVAYLDFAGSGNETARHAAAGGPVTVMVMSTSDDPAIVRLYGTATVTPLDGSPLQELIEQAPSAQRIGLGKRQVIEVAVERTQTSCGYGVPVMEHVADRTTASRGRRYKD